MPKAKPENVQLSTSHRLPVALATVHLFRDLGGTMPISKDVDDRKGLLNRKDLAEIEMEIIR